MRYLQFAPLFALPIAFGLTLGAAPQTAEAGKACKRANLPSPCIVRSDIKANAIVSSKVKDESLTGTDVLDGTITGADIAADTIGTADIATNGVGAAEIAAGAVGQSEIATNGVGAAEIAAGAVGTSEIATGGVAGAEVANGSLFDVDMADEAGADGAFTQSCIALTTTGVTVQTVVLTAPTSGHVIVNASGTFDGTASTLNRGNCNLTRNSTTLGPFDLFHDFDQTQSAFAVTKFFANVPAGTSTLRLLCRESFTEMSVCARSMNALFVPTQY